MTTRLKKKNNKSSLNRNYVEKFVSNVESKLSNFNIQFLTPYKEKLDKLDSSVIKDIEKDFKLPTLLIKNAVDDLWNYHWVLGQKDVLSSEKNKVSNYSGNLNLTTFAQTRGELIVEKKQLQESNKRIRQIQRELRSELSSDSRNQNNIDGLVGKLKNESSLLEKILGSIRSNGTEKQLAFNEVRIRDLQETIRVLELEAYEDKNNTNVTTGIDILNSSEFGTIYINKRTLLLSQNYSSSYKNKVIKKIQNYFDTTTNGKRYKNREQTLFDSLTTKGDSVTEINRVKQIVNTEISLAYNLGRLKKLQELGYTRVKVTNERENTINRVIALSQFSGKLWKVYKQPDKEKLMPLLCNFCAEMDGREFNINTIYEGKVNTQFHNRYSRVPPFHVSCWCYFVGVDDRDKKDSLLPVPQSQINDALLLSSIGLTSVVGAYLAFNKFGGNKVKLSGVLKKTKEVIKETAEKALVKVQSIPKKTKGTVDNLLTSPKVNIPKNIGGTVDNLLGRPKVNIPQRQLQEVNKITDEVFDAVELDTKQLLGIPLNLSSKQPELVEEMVVNNIDEVVSNTPYKTLNVAPKTFNTVIEEIPSYVQSLQPIIKAREDYYRLRNIIYDTSVALETRQSLYSTYITSRTNYDSLITRHLSDTRNLKNTVNSIQSQISVDANRQLLANRGNLPNNLTLEDALNSVRSRKALTFTDNQLKTIRDNLTLERKQLREKIGVESRVLDSALDGVDTQQKVIELRNVSSNISETTASYVAKPKTLDKIITNIDSIKKELNNINTTKDTIRSLSTSRISSGNLIDRQLLIDTQETYIKKVIKQQKILAKELEKLPDDIDEVDNFVNLYRSEIADKAKTNYPYSRNTWSNNELSSLNKQYKKASDLITTRNTYQSYLDETEDMLVKLSNFETTIVDNTIKFSDNYSNDIIINRDVLKKISKLPNIKDIVFNT